MLDGVLILVFFILVIFVPSIRTSNAHMAGVFGWCVFIRYAVFYLERNTEIERERIGSHAIQKQSMKE